MNGMTSNGDDRWHGRQDAAFELLAWLIELAFELVCALFGG
jgi:hypothetical protein